MTEREIRDRLRKAVGESGYPPDLTGRIQASVAAQKMAPRRRTPLVLGLVAALLAVAIVGSLIYVGQFRNARHTIPGGPPKGDTSVPDGLWPRQTNFAYDSTRGEVVLFGGQPQFPTNDTWTWDGRQWSKRAPAVRPPVLYDTAITDDPDLHVVVLYGVNGSGWDETWLWDGKQWKQALSAHTPTASGGMAMTYDTVRHVVLLFGGVSRNVGVLNETWTWDGVDWVQKKPTSSPPARSDARLAFDPARGNAVLFGGFQASDDTWTWDGSTWTERHPGKTPPPLLAATQAHQQMVYDSARKVVVFVSAAHHSSLTADDTGETWTWDGTTWALLTAPTPLRYNYGLAFDAKRSVTVLAGGSGNLKNEANTTWGWNGASWTGLAGPLTGASPPTPPASTSKGPFPLTANFAYDSTRDEVIVFGGGGGGIGSDETWTWNGRAWTQRTSANSPSLRIGAAISDDPEHRVVVLFGGGGVGKALGDTWLWDGTNWKQVFPAHSPSPRAGAAVTYDPVHHVVLLFGGNGLNDTWTWDGVDWTLRISSTSSVASGPRATAPSGRSYARLAFDVTRGNAVLYGGSGYSPLTDTWTWDGTKWTQRNPPTTPPATYQFTPVPLQMVYDPASKVIVFVDEVDHNSACAAHTMETWTWDGTNWTQVVSATSPPIRSGFGLAYDLKHSLTVLAGGWTCSFMDDTSTWGWNGSNWSKIG